MKQSVKKRWVRALRSGECKQNDSRLCKMNDCGYPFQDIEDYIEENL